LDRGRVREPGAAHHPRHMIPSVCHSPVAQLVIF
jgi:hypothetical protein